MVHFYNDHNTYISNELIKREIYDRFVRQTSVDGLSFPPWRTDHISRASQYVDFLLELSNIVYPEIAKSFLSDVYEDMTCGDDDFSIDNNINDLIYAIISKPWTILYPDYYAIGGWTENRMGHYTCADHIRDMEIKRRDSSDIEHIDMYQFIPYYARGRRPATVKAYDTLSSDFSSEEFELKQFKTESVSNYRGRRLYNRWS